MPVPELINTDKVIISFPGWGDPTPETGVLWFNAPLDVDGVTDMILHGECTVDLPDCAVSFELRGYAPPRPTKRSALDRIDWRPVDGGHWNPRRKSIVGSGRRVEGTHRHVFDLNWVEHEGRLRKGNLRQAIEIDEEPQSFESLIAMVGKAFRISNMSIVSVPPWRYELYRNG